MQRCTFFLVMAVCLASLFAFALPGQSMAAQEDGWRFRIAPYAWLAGQKGSVATLPGLPAADIDIDFYDDIFGNINGAIMLLCEARKDRIGVVVDITYTDIESENVTPGPFFFSSQFKIQNLDGVSRRFLPSGRKAGCVY